MFTAIAIAAVTHQAVKPGDTLSAIAAAHGTSYERIAADSHISDPDLIFPGEELTITTGTARADAAVSTTVHAAAGKVWGKTYGYPYKCGDGDGDGYDEPCSKVFPAHVQAPVHPHAAVTVSSETSSYGRSYHASGGMEACIIARESGGNPDVTNASGHWGLYQFSESTWVASGGSPSSFGSASAAEQHRVFENAVAARGYSDWAPYDGC